MVVTMVIVCGGTMLGGGVFLRPKSRDRPDE
jgi:hypothetical protein